MEKIRLNEFRDAVDSLNIKSGAPDRDKLYHRLGAILMVAGIVLAFIAYFLAGSQNSGDLAVDNIEHNEHIILAICGISITVAGAATFIKFGITRFMRFWLIRKIYEDGKP
ncbi:MAG: hypothetical protein CL522_01260 [Actinobacteria bacterium]|nr:hypothetical protein [Actinomycetota bacterium]|tara:strand:- start:1080 stop:1412 length:333 start_codon:yes stop_codon:yes gene_type:complete